MLERHVWRQKVLVVFRISISVGLVLVLLSQTSLDKLWVVIESVNVGLLLFMLLIQIPLVILFAYRWLLLLMAQGVILPLDKLFYYYLIGYFFNMFLPTSVGGDVVRIALLSRSNADGATVTASVVVDRLTGLLGLVVVGSCALIANQVWGVPLAYGWPVALLLVLFGGLILFGFWGSSRLRMTDRISGTRMNIRGRLYRLVFRFIVSIQIYSRKPRLLLRVLGVSILSQLLVGASAWLTAQAMLLNIPFLALLGIANAVTVLTLLPISINGLGLQDVGYTAMLQPLGVSVSAALLFSILWHSQRYVYALIGGVVYALGLDAKRVEEEMR